MKTLRIIGTAITDFGELYDKSLSDLFREAVDEALLDAQLPASAIEAVFVANKAGGSFNHQRHLNALVSQFFPHYPPAMRIEGACASGSLAVLAAEQALLSGMYETVLVVGAEKMTDVSSAETTAILASAADHEKEYASTFPALYALLADYHMQKFGTTREELSAVVVKNHQHALQNPHAQFHKALSAAAVSRSALVASPLRVLDCSPISDGAAALILSSKPLPAKAEVLGFGQGQDALALADRDDISGLNATKKALSNAIKMSKLSIKNIDAAEVHDCFSIAEILAVEDLGFCPKGMGGKWIASGSATFGAKVVINPSGGLKACGHPVGATGVKQIAFLSQQIAAGKFVHALSHNVGGSGATAVVHILGPAAAVKRVKK